MIIVNFYSVNIRKHGNKSTFSILFLIILMHYCSHSYPSNNYCIQKYKLKLSTMSISSPKIKHKQKKKLYSRLHIYIKKKMSCYGRLTFFSKTSINLKSWTFWVKRFHYNHISWAPEALRPISWFKTWLEILFFLYI